MTCLLSIGCSNVKQTTFHIPISTTEYEVINTLIKHKEKERRIKLGDDRLVVIRNTPMIYNDNYDEVISKCVSKDLLLDLKRKNVKRYEFENKFDNAGPHKLLSDDEYNEVFNGSGLWGLDLEWKAFHKKYPKAGGIYSFSRVGFNKEKNSACVWIYYGIHDFGQYKYFCVLELQNSKWIIKHSPIHIWS